MSQANFRVPEAINEPIELYAPGSSQKKSLKNRLEQMEKEKIEIPCRIGGKEVRTGNLRKVVMPHAHGHVLAEFHLAGPNELKAAADAARSAKGQWESLEWQKRAEIFLKAADLLAGPYRDTINAATMLGQSKTVMQAEIDAACEFIDFLRFNASYYQRISEMQPSSAKGIWNRMEYRALEGFVLAITPFNFTAIAGNLCAAPAMMGNTVVWKPSDTQMLSAHYTYELFKEAGLPEGVINMVAADGPLTGETLLPMRDLGGVHFTGSTATFRTIYSSVGKNIANYQSYPRLVGETGGKDFVFAHPSADRDALRTALIRGAFEFQGQKCSAASRAYIPKSMWPSLKEGLVSEVQGIRIGDVRDFSNFMSAVIDERAFKKITGYIDRAKQSNDANILVGGKYSSDHGYFVDPTVIEATSPTYESMVEEIFGPVLSLYVYDDHKMDETLDLCDRSTPYGLTGAIFSQDRYAVEKMSNRLRHSAGNFYVNDKPTGAVVGQQPFGGARASGTNDKAGSLFNLLRWCSPRTMKETFDPPKNYRYPHMDES